jgi:hypothetical protein
MQWLYILAVYYSAMHFLIKNAFLAYYLRLSVHRRFRLSIGLGFGLNIGLLLINLLLIVFQCIPVAAAYNPLMRLRGAECMNRYYILMAPSTVVRPRGYPSCSYIPICRTVILNTDSRTSFSISTSLFFRSRLSGDCKCHSAKSSASYRCSRLEEYRSS